MQGQILDADGARLLIDKVVGDRTLPAPARRAARRLLLHTERPELVLDRLQRRAELELPALERNPVTTDLARVVPASTFWQYHSTPEVHEAFLSADDFILAVESQENPAAFLLSSLSTNAELSIWKRSWLTEDRSIRGLTGAQLNSTLELEKRPPFVVFVLSASNCRRLDVRIRRPCSLDSVLAPNLQWTPGGLRSGVPEYVDGDLPRDAVSAIRWVA